MRSGFSRTRVFSYALAKPEGSDGKYKKDLGVPKHALTERDLLYTDGAVDYNSCKW